MKTNAGHEPLQMHVYDTAFGLPVLLDDGNRKYIHRVGGLAYVDEGLVTGLRVYHTDGLGSVRALSDARGWVVQTYQTDEFGVPEPLNSLGASTQSFQYTGEQRDQETGFVYLRARMYDPALGRFIQADPLRKSGPGVGGWNRYTYVGNNPTTLADPTGLDPLGVFAHQMIERVFTTEHPNFSAEVLHRDPNAPWWNPLLGSYRIDLEDEATGVFYEIKPWNERNAGLAQVADRMSRGHSPGGPQPDLYINGWLPGLILHAWSDVDGLLLYEWTWEPPAVIPFPFPLPGRQPSRIPRRFPNPAPVPVPIAAFSQVKVPLDAWDAPPGKSQLLR